MRGLIIVLLLMLVTALTAVIHQVGAFSGGTSNFNSVFVERNTAYVTDNGWSASEGFYIIDVSNHSNPFLRGIAQFPYRSYEIEVYSRRAYVAAGVYGFQVWDVSNAAAPLAITTIDDTLPCEKLTISGNRLYVIYSNGFRIYDISSPIPVLLNFYANYDLYDIMVEGDLAYMTGSNPCLKILNVANPNAIQTVGTFNGFYSSKSVSKQGDLLYLSDEFNDHFLLNVANPSAPVQMSVFTDMWLKCHGIHNGHLFVMLDQPGTGSKLLKVYDLANPALPVLAASCVVPTMVNSLFISGNYLYVTVSLYGLLIFDISDISNPALISTSHIPSEAIQMELRNDFAYIADADNRLIQVNITDPANPRLISQYSLPHPFMDMQVQEDRLFVTTSNAGLKIFQLGEDDHPQENNFQLLGSLALDSYPRDILVEGNYIYIANDEDLRIVDITDPSSPQVISQYANATLLYGYLILAKYQNYVYMGSFGEPVGIIDVSDVHNPAMVGLFGQSAVTASLAVKGHYLFQTGYCMPILIYDLSNPLHPVLVNTIPSSSDEVLFFIQDDLLFASYLTSNSIKCFDISHPLSPIQTWNYIWSFPSFDIDYRDGLLYTCNREFGFSIINAGLLSPVDDPQPVPLAEQRFSSYPNPFRSSTTLKFDLEATTFMSLDVYNLRGQLVRKLFHGTKSQGEHTLGFDGRDESGRALPSGVYLIKASVGTDIEVLRVMLIK